MKRIKQELDNVKKELSYLPPAAPSLYYDKIYCVHYLDRSIKLVKVGGASLIPRETNLEQFTFLVGIGQSLYIRVQAVYDNSVYDDVRFFQSEYYNFRMVKVCNDVQAYNVAAYSNNFECSSCFIKCCLDDTDYINRISLERESLDNGITEWVFTFESENDSVKVPLDTKKIIGFMWKHLELNITHVQKALDDIIEWKSSVTCFNEVLYRNLFSKYVNDLEKLKQWREKLNFQV
jgi:hypothetical protein